MKLGSKLVLAASLALGLASVDVNSASAAIVRYAFTVDSPTTRGNGIFSFDDSTFIDGEAILKSLSFQFDGDSNVYTEEDDLKSPAFPIVYTTILSTGKTSLALDYQFDDKANPASSIRYEIAGEDFTAFSINTSDAELISGTVSYRKVPEPTILGGLLLVGSVTLMMKRKDIVMGKLKA
ncbi:PEP-CTERM sorting domain-containing protein [Nostoc sp. UHCC 0870]|uniref:PEP-CTERM sorting domain-containing protein n=1 Tax=Nostoc sp. UHCC 0870 TaxID=2914041 RepID=UPI001EDFD336|nr:PEP-CTERM sorting domain-containing protein [Nostoc sp. UHCC 0870]UKO96686.1 PEP-CTERM sorting domain-containing protein [Nostoc sp. UHCC 0870]